MPIDSNGPNPLRRPASGSRRHQSPDSSKPTAERQIGRRGNTRHSCYSAEAGFTLIEVLVAAVIISVALLGLAALQTTSVRFNQSALIRTQAVSLSYDLADRMRANSANATDYDSDNTAPAGSLAEEDIDDWNARVAELLPTGTPTSSIQVTGDDQVTIQIQFTDRDNENLSFQMTTRL